MVISLAKTAIGIADEDDPNVVMYFHSISLEILSVLYKAVFFFLIIPEFIELFIPRHLKSGGYYVIPSKKNLRSSVRPSVRPSIRPSVCPSVSASFPGSILSSY